MHELPIGIDPGEAILAIVGLRPFMLRETARIYASEWTQIGDIKTTIEDLADKLVKGTVPDSSEPDLAYDKMLDGFTAPISPEVIGKITDAFPPEYHNATGLFVGTLAKAWQYLKAHFPVSVEQTLTSTHNLKPSDYALGLFEDLLEIVDKPLSVFGMVDIGRMTSAQAVALSNVYPELYKEIVGAIVRAILAAKFEDEDYEPEFDRGLSVLLAVPGIDPKLRTLLGAPGATSTAPQPATPEGAGKLTPAGQAAKRTATRTQNIDSQQAQEKA